MQCVVIVSQEPHTASCSGIPSSQQRARNQAWKQRQHTDTPPAHSNAVDRSYRPLCLACYTTINIHLMMYEVLSTTLVPGTLVCLPEVRTRYAPGMVIRTSCLDLLTVNPFRARIRNVSLRVVCMYSYAICMTNVLSCAKAKPGHQQTTSGTERKAPRL